MAAATLVALNPGKVAAAREPESKKATAPTRAAALRGERERIFLRLRASSLALYFCFSVVGGERWEKGRAVSGERGRGEREKEREKEFEKEREKEREKEFEKEREKESAGAVRLRLESALRSRSRKLLNVGARIEASRAATNNKLPPPFISYSRASVPRTSPRATAFSHIT